LRRDSTDRRKIRFNHMKGLSHFTKREAESVLVSEEEFKVESRVFLEVERDMQGFYYSRMGLVHHQLK